MWVHRLPSLISATLAVVLTYWVALPLVGPGPALLAGLLMAVSLILGVEARLAKTDATLLATVLAAQGVLVRAYLSFKNEAPEAFFTNTRAWSLPLLFWTALAAGTLVKGPLILLFVGLTVASLVITERSAAFLVRLRPLSGALWYLLLVLPWYLAIGLRTDGAFYQEAIGFSVVGKITQSHEGHGAPPLTHLAWFWAIFWPGSLFFALSLAGIWQRRREAWVRFLICWAVPSWIVFELIVTKLPHYLLPVFPAVAIASAGVLSSRALLSGRRWGRRGVAVVLIVLTILAVAASTGVVWLSRGETMSSALVAVCVLSILVFGLTSRWSLRSLRQNDLAGCCAALITAMVALYWLTIPALARIPVLWPAPGCCRHDRDRKKMRRTLPCRDRLIPARDEAKNLRELIPEILSAFSGESIEIIVIDDASADETVGLVKAMRLTHPEVRLIQNRPAAGKSGALWIGAKAARGEFGVTIDGDGQNDPRDLTPMIELLRSSETLGLVAGQRKRRGDGRWRAITSRIANSVRGFMLGDNTRDSACGLKAFRMAAFRGLPYFETLHRFLPALIAADGWRVAHIDVTDRRRRFGRSKYGILDRLAVGIPDLFGVWWLVRRRRRQATVKSTEDQ